MLEFIWHARAEGSTATRCLGGGRSSASSCAALLGPERRGAAGVAKIGLPPVATAAALIDRAIGRTLVEVAGRTS